MRLYHFTSAKYGLEAIRKRRLKVAEILELNDPFEFLGPVVDTPEDRRALQKWKKQLAISFGIICMSDNWRHPLLWGHYAEKHKGVALGFDVLNPELFQPVRYVERRKTVDDYGVAALSAFGEAEMRTTLYEKFSAWQYEAEYRAYVKLDQKDPKLGLYFMDFVPVLKLAEVIVGSRSDLKRRDVQDALGDYVEHVDAFMSRPAFRSYNVVRQKNDRMWK
ncbi:hypothetical protein J2R99_002190 [Rhodopseudomonas julia]|uniref:DUF2971 domain-containing protein n=1 Tax=Rhodopseudomonas julia TaxID=200617 RepID=A0ABU0C720_9BRAD|nr:DUF2971 domain-containing protein [Rhodopseudomonas julia]MDQ0326321.1 hypothetical protein [Rhodopseudomonas julia]